MILKNCKLSNKEKLKVVLNHFCYSYIDPQQAKGCESCSYFNNMYGMIFEAGERIKAATRRGRANYIVIRPELAKKMEKLLKNE